jgi:DNA-binding transcriptional MerR regulator
MVEKAAGAFRTIGELADELGLPQHILRYWETRFPQLKPLTRAGNRRYYRPEDVALAKRINALLNVEGYTVKGVQKLLSSKGGGTTTEIAPQPAPPAPQISASSVAAEALIPALQSIHNRLAKALAIA